MRLGISSYTFGWAIGVRGNEPRRPMDENDLLDRCRDFGVKVLQIGDNLPLHTFSEDRLARLAKRAANEGIELEAGARGLTPSHVKTYVAIAQRLNARLLRFVIDDAEYHPPVAQISDVLREVAPILGGVLLGLENHDRFTAAEFLHIVQSGEHPNIGVCLDTANSLGAGEGIETVANVLAERVVNLHVKDFHVSRVPYLMGFEVAGRPAGQGLLNVEGLLRLLKKAPRCETAILELWVPPEANLDDTIKKEQAWAQQSIDYLKPLLHSVTTFP